MNNRPTDTYFTTKWQSEHLILVLSGHSWELQISLESYRIQNWPTLMGFWGTLRR